MKKIFYKVSFCFDGIIFLEANWGFPLFFFFHFFFICLLSLSLLLFSSSISFLHYICLWNYRLVSASRICIQIQFLLHSLPDPYRCLYFSSAEKCSICQCILITSDFAWCLSYGSQYFLCGPHGCFNFYAMLVYSSSFLILREYISAYLYLAGSSLLSFS